MKSKGSTSNSPQIGLDYLKMSQSVVKKSGPVELDSTIMSKWQMTCQFCFFSNWKQCQNSKQAVIPLPTSLRPRGARAPRSSHLQKLQTINFDILKIQTVRCRTWARNRLRQIIQLNALFISCATTWWKKKKCLELTFVFRRHKNHFCDFRIWIWIETQGFHVCKTNLGRLSGFEKRIGA